MSWSIQSSFVKIRDFGLSPNFNLIWTQSVKLIYWKYLTHHTQLFATKSRQWKWRCRLRIFVEWVPWILHHLWEKKVLHMVALFFLLSSNFEIGTRFLAQFSCFHLTCDPPFKNDSTLRLSHYVLLDAYKLMKYECTCYKW